MASKITLITREDLVVDETADDVVAALTHGRAWARLTVQSGALPGPVWINPSHVVHVQPHPGGGGSPESG